MAELLFVCFGEVLVGGGYQCGADDLPAPRQVAMAQQLADQRLKQCRRTICAQALLVVPNGVAIGDVDTVSEQAKALVTHAVQKLILGLLIAEVLEVLEDQNAHHDLGGLRWTSAPAGIASGQQLIDDARKVSKVDMPGNHLQ